MQLYRFDLVFSYWILLWYFLHILGYVRASPKLALIVALVEITFLVIELILLTKPLQSILGFIGINIFIKVIPLATIWHEKIRWLHDIAVLAALYFVYIVYILIVQGLNPLNIFNKTYESIQQSLYDPTTNPMMTVFHDLYIYYERARAITD